MMKLGTVMPYLRKIQEIYKLRDTLLSSSDICILSSEISKFCYIKKYKHRFHFDTTFPILSTFFESLKIFLVNMVTTLMMSAKMATLDFPEMKLFWNNRYYVIVFNNDTTSKIVWCDSNYIVGIVIWPYFVTLLFL